MIILVDTNVISDIVHDDPTWRPWSEMQMSAHVGMVAINPFIYAELCCRAKNPAELDDALTLLGIRYEEISKDALFLAAQAFLVYRQRGGGKTAPLPDFFIGAHAAALGIPIITRDIGRYRTYFPGVELICP
jgi:predicted nucleic acid-binding protein